MTIAPSRVTTRNDRFWGWISAPGSRRERSNSSARRNWPMSLRSGPVFEPFVWTRWQVRHAPLPSKTALSAVAISGNSSNGRGRERSQVGDDGARLLVTEVTWRHVGADDTVPNNSNQIRVRGRLSKFTVRESTPNTASPSTPWHVAQFARNSRSPCMMIGGRGFVLGDERRDDQDQSGQLHQGRRTSHVSAHASPRSEYCA